MFVIVLNYVKPISEVERYVSEHRAFLAQYYDSGHFLLSGRKEPRTGGVIICQAESREQVEKIIQRDPFYREHIAKYDVIEFVPTMTAAQLASFQVASDEHYIRAPSGYAHSDGDSGNERGHLS